MGAQTKTKRSLNCQFEESLYNWLETSLPEERLKNGIRLLAGITPDALKSAGADNLEIYWHTTKIAKIMNEHSGMTLEVIESVPEVLENPVLVMRSKTVKSRVTMFGDAVDANGKPVLVVLELSPGKTGETADYAVIASAYGKKGAQSFINSSEILYMEPDKKRTDKWLLALGLQLPSAITVYGPVNNIHNSHEKSNEKINQKNSDTNRTKANTEPTETTLT